jgi:ribonucleotide reductase beta subunit family protein with ferritin-like domain
MLEIVMLSPHDADEPLLHEQINEPPLVIGDGCRRRDLFDLAVIAENSFWTTSEIDFGRDRDDWEKQTPAVRHLILTVLAFFAASDGVVLENLMQRFYMEVKAPEARYFYGIQMGIETVHSRVYSELVLLYERDPVKQRELFTAIEHLPVVREKANWAQRFTASAEASFAKRLVAFAVVEGIFFTSSFAIIAFFKQKGILPALTFSNELIRRDEGLHRDFACLLYRTYVKHQLSREELLEVVLGGYTLECQFIDYALPDGIIGLSSEMLKQHLQCVVDALLIQLGSELYFGLDTPLDFIDNVAAESKSNFFERRVSEYQRAGVGAVPDAGAFTLDADF